MNTITARLLAALFSAAMLSSCASMSNVAPGRTEFLPLGTNPAQTASVTVASGFQILGVDGVSGAALKNAVGGKSPELLLKPGTHTLLLTNNGSMDVSQRGLWILIHRFDAGQKYGVFFFNKGTATPNVVSVAAKLHQMSPGQSPTNMYGWTDVKTLPVLAGSLFPIEFISLLNAGDKVGARLPTLSASARAGFEKQSHEDDALKSKISNAMERNGIKNARITVD